MPAWTGAGLITGSADVDRVVAAVNQTYRAGTETLAHAVQPATAAELADSAATLLPILPELRRGLPWPGLRRGATVSVVGSTSLLFALLAGGMSEGGWAAILGMPEAGVLSAQEMGVPLPRLALVPDPGPDWPTVAAALIDGMALMVINAYAEERTIRSLQARARERGCVLIATRPMPGADVVLERTSVEWLGLGQGRGRLKWQHARFRTTGRGKSTRPTSWEMVFPPLSQLTDQQVQAAIDLYHLKQQTAASTPTARTEPRHDLLPASQPSAKPPDGDLWSSIVPNRPPDPRNSLTEQPRGQRK